MGKRVSRIALLRGPGTLLIEITGKEMVPQGASTLMNHYRKRPKSKKDNNINTTTTTTTHHQLQHKPWHHLNSLKGVSQTRQSFAPSLESLRGRQLLARPVLRQVELAKPREVTNRQLPATFTLEKP